MEYLPEPIRKEIKNYIKEKNNIENLIEEIRLRINQNLTLKIGQDIQMLNYKITREEITEAFENISEKSVYSYIKQIAEGFITIKGGNRVGITGSCVIENEKITNINYISSLNFRIARQIKDIAIPFFKYVIDIQNNTIFNTLIVSPPGGGKTTLLRDLTRNISNRNTRNWI
jgi:stage III sporulation protein AA